jgi:microcystin-dependent protein
MEGIIGYTTLFAGNFAPKNWALCQGQTISIQSNTALFSILGTTYGGNGTTTFMLPNLQGRAVVGAGQGPGLSHYDLGQQGGTELVTIDIQSLPAHTHPVSYTITQDSANTISAAIPTNKTYASDDSGSTTPYTSPANVGLKPFAGSITTASTGSNVPLSIITPYVALSYLICLAGVFPARN